MTIAKIQFDGIGVRTYAPEGPYGTAGNFPLLPWTPGDVVSGDAESEFVFLIYTRLLSSLAEPRAIELKIFEAVNFIDRREAYMRPEARPVNASCPY